MGSKASKARKAKKAGAKKAADEAGTATAAAAPPVAPTHKKSSAEAPKGAATSSPEAKFRANQWTVEDVENGNVDVVVEKTMHAVAVYGCKGSGIHISGKCASVQIDGVKKTSIFVENVVGNVEISNSKSVKVYVTGVAPCIMIDKSDGVLVDISKDCAANPDFIIVAANSSEMNCAFEFKGEMRELPIPEQFVHQLAPNDKIDTRVSSLYE